MEEAARRRLLTESKEQRTAVERRRKPLMATSNRASSGLGVFSKGEEEDALFPFPEFLGLGDEQNDGEEHLNVRPWSSFGVQRKTLP